MIQLSDNTLNLFQQQVFQSKSQLRVMTEGVASGKTYVAMLLLYKHLLHNPNNNAIVITRRSSHIVQFVLDTYFMNTPIYRDVLFNRGRVQIYSAQDIQGQILERVRLMSFNDKTRTLVYFDTDTDIALMDYVLLRAYPVLVEGYLIVDKHNKVGYDWYQQKYYNLRDGLRTTEAPILKLLNE